MGVQTYLAKKQVTSTDELLETAIETGIDTGIINIGDTVVITAGVPVGEVGATNLMKVHVISE
ncbi:hypothetical protein GCM10020331_102980 [Ectobacillus funiculus]